MFDFLGFIPEAARNKLKDVVVDGLFKATKGRLDDKQRQTIRSLRSNGAFLNAFDKALTRAVERFIQEYTDSEVTRAILTNARFWQADEIHQALQHIAASPSDYLNTQRVQVEQRFGAILPDLDPQRVDAAIAFFLKCMAKEMLTIPEFKQDYILHFVRLQAGQNEQIMEGLARVEGHLQALSQGLALNAPGNNNNLPAPQAPQLPAPGELTLPPHKQQRYDQLKEILTGAYELLSQLETSILTESNPLQRAAYKTEIKRLEQNIDDYENELAEVDAASRPMISSPVPLIPIEPARPRSYIPFPRSQVFQPRPGEFEKLESLLLSSTSSPTRLGLVGVVGMGGIGKTRLAVELAYRCQDQGLFLEGVFWMTATGSQYDWQRELAELAVKTDYPPPEDDPSNPENEIRRARHFCRYLAEHSATLLILDNVDDPGLVVSVLPQLAGKELKCALLYTSRVKSEPHGVITHAVEQLPEEAALRLILEDTRPVLLREMLSSNTEAEAARQLCRTVGYLPLALIHLRTLLAKSPNLKLTRLIQVLEERSKLEVVDKKDPYAPSLFATFRLSWEKVNGIEAQRLFKLAAYFPEAAPIPLWLLGLAADLGESYEVFDPLGETYLYLQELSLFEELAEGQVRLHPLVREFGQRLVQEEPDKGKTTLKEAGQRLASAFEDLGDLEERARQGGYWGCLAQVGSALEYTKLLGTDDEAQRLDAVERRLDRESHLLGTSELWPKKLPGLFYQQIYNRVIEEDQHPVSGKTSLPWIRQLNQIGTSTEEKTLVRILSGHHEAIASVAFSPNGCLILTGSADRTARLWEATTGKPLISFIGHTDVVLSVVFSPNSNYVLTGSKDKTARLWDVTTGALITIFEGHVGAIRSVAFSPNGNQILTGSEDKTARLWNTITGKLIITFKSHDEAITSVAFSPDGLYGLIGSNDKTAHLWKLNPPQLVFALQHEDRVISVAFSPDGSQVLTGSEDGLTRLWDSTTNRLIALFKGHTRGVRSVAFSPNGNQILTGSEDKTARLWNIATGKLIAIFEGHSWSVRSAVFSPDGQHILTGSIDNTVRLWKISKDSNDKILDSIGSYVWDISFSPDGRYVATGSRDNIACLWEVSTKKLLTSFEGHTGEVTSVAFSSKDPYLLTGSGDGTVRLWEATTGKFLATSENSELGSVECVTLSPDGQKIIAGSIKGTVQLWSLDDTNCFSSIAVFQAHTDSVRDIVFSQDGRLVLTCSIDQIARLWEMPEGKLVMTFRGHSRAVNRVSFSSDGRFILTGSSDGTARLWEISTGRCVTVFEGSGGYIWHITFSPDSRLVVTCHSNSLVRFWSNKGEETGQLLALYMAAYEIGDVYWQGSDQLMLADKGGYRGRPNIYRLKLEGF
ncbi:MAG: NB-ARC domain-containing protein [Chloroflexota bacterium]|nr:hypothetical protein [Chloroflexota bacterium]